ncbi:MAG: ribosome silencing factor [Bdellovibrionales bacterium]|nr:ribosome silencing factor [Bdellovibrionales bacterium]
MTRLNKHKVSSAPALESHSSLTEVNESLGTVQRVVDACLEAKGRELSILDVHDVFDIADYFVIVSGRSDRQTQGITNRVLSALEEQGIHPEFVEGYEEGHWVIIDCIDVVVHVFYEPMREQYDLEGLWVKAKKLCLSRDSEGREVLSAA